MIATTSAVPENSWPVIESRDVIARINQLESWIIDLSIELDWADRPEQRATLEAMKEEVEALILLDDMVRASARDWRNTRLYRYDNPDRSTVSAPYEAFFDDVPYYFA